MNYEIELKAHVDDRKNVISVLNGLGTYLGHTEKSDDYYHFSLKDRTAPDGRDFLSARIRKEKLTLDDKTESCCYFTYKRKENKTGDDGTKIEVNEENEIKCTDASALEVFFADLGAKIDLHKEKDVEQWNVVVPTSRSRASVHMSFQIVTTKELPRCSQVGSGRPFLRHASIMRPIPVPSDSMMPAKSNTFKTSSFTG